MKINNIKELKDKLNKGSKKRRIEAEINNYAHYPEKYDNATLTTLVLNFKELMENPDTLPSSMAVKKLASTLLTDGRYRELDINTFREFIGALYSIELFYDKEDLSNYIMSLRQIELKRLKKEFESGEDKSSPVQKSKELDMLYEFMYQASFFTNSGDNSRNIIMELLKEKHGIDLKQGINLTDVPGFVYDSAINLLSRYMLKFYTHDSEKEIIDSNLELIKRRIEDAISTNPSGKAEMVLLKEPIILELYNLANCEVEVTGKTVPSKENREKIKELLAILPEPEPVSKEEEYFFNSICLKYKKIPMPEDVFKKYKNIYLKRIMNLVVSGEYEKSNMSVFADTLLGQVAMDNPVSRPDNSVSLQNLYKIALRDYANGLLKFNFPDKKTQLTMIEDRAHPHTRGAYYPETKRIYVNGRTKNRDEIVDSIIAMSHEIEHGLTELHYSTGSYSITLEYLSNKLTAMRAKIPNIVRNGGFNYAEAAYEIIARLSGFQYGLGFLRHHGVDIEKDELAKKISNAIELDGERSTVSSVINNPKYHNKTTQYDEHEKSKELLIAKMIGQYKEKIFDAELYKKYKEEFLDPEKKLVDEQIEEEEIFRDETGPLSNLNDLFDKFVKNHRELCCAGSYFGIEYNPNGERKSLKEILRDMRSLWKSDDYDQRRALYKYIIEACIIPNTRANEAIDTLIEYRPANAKDDKLVAEIVDDMIEPLLLRVAKEAQPIESKMEMDKVIARIVTACKEDDKRVQKSRQTSTQSKLRYTPFVKGITRHARKNRENQKKPSLFTPTDIGKKLFGKIIDKYDKIESIDTTDYIPL